MKNVMMYVIVFVLAVGSVVWASNNYYNILKKEDKIVKMYKAEIAEAYKAGYMKSLEISTEWKKDLGECIKPKLNRVCLAVRFGSFDIVNQWRDE